VFQRLLLGLHARCSVRIKNDPLPEFGLYTILPSPILYGVCHTKGGPWGGVYGAIGVQ